MRYNIQKIDGIQLTKLLISYGLGIVGRYIMKLVRWVNNNKSK